MASNRSSQAVSAVDRLQDLLVQLDQGSSPSALSRNSNTSPESNSVPKSTEFYLLLQTADEISHRLRDENYALRDDNQTLQSNLVNLIEENNQLHEEMRSTFISDMLRLINIDDEKQITDKESIIVDLYTKKMHSLDIELKDTKEKLKIYETLAHETNDFICCLKCGALLPFHQNMSQSDDKFAEIITENETNKRKLNQIQVKLEQSESKEREALAKLQVSVTNNEHNQFEKSEAIMERDQIKIELVQTQKRLKNFINEMNETITHEKSNIETVYNTQLKESAEKIQQIEEKCTQYELTIDRLIREKISLNADLDVWKERMQQQEIDLNQTTNSIKLTIQQAMHERDQANINTMHIRSDFEKLLLQSNQDLLQLRHQLSFTQNRLNDMENELLQSKKQSLDLIEETSRLKKENMMLKNIKQSLEQSHAENMDAIVVILNQREQEYRTALENFEQELGRDQSLLCLENLVSDQNMILNKMRLYSRQLTNDIAVIIKEKDEIIHDITNENQEFRLKLSNAYERLEQIDEQLLQHCNTHIKLQQRITDLNNKVQAYESIFNQFNVHG